MNLDYQESNFFDIGVVQGRNRPSIGIRIKVVLDTTNDVDDYNNFSFSFFDFKIPIMYIFQIRMKNKNDQWLYHHPVKTYRSSKEMI